MDKVRNISPRGRVKPVLRSKHTLQSSERVDKVLNKVSATKEKKKDKKIAQGKINQVFLDLESNRGRSYVDMIRDNNSMKKSARNSNLKPKVWDHKTLSSKDVKSIERKPNKPDVLKKDSKFISRKVYKQKVEKTSIKAPISVNLYRDGSSVSNRSVPRTRLVSKSKDMTSSIKATIDLHVSSKKSEEKVSKNVIYLTEDPKPAFEENKPPNEEKADKSKGKIWIHLVYAKISLNLIMSKS